MIILYHGEMSFGELRAMLASPPSDDLIKLTVVLLYAESADQITRDDLQNFVYEKDQRFLLFERSGPYEDS